MQKELYSAFKWQLRINRMCLIGIPSIQGFKVYRAWIFQIAELSSSSVVAVILGIVWIPILAMHFQPAELGKFALFFAAYQLFGSVAMARYEQALFLINSPRLARLHFLLCLGMLVVSSTILSCVGLVIFETTSVAVISSLAEWWAPAIFAGATASINLLFTAAFIRIGKFRLVSILRILRPAIAVPSQIGVSLTTSVDGFSSLIYGEIGSLIVLTLICLSMGLRNGVLDLKTAVTLRVEAVYRLARNYVFLPKISLLHTLTHGILSWLSLVSISYLFGNDAAGQYYLVLRVCMLPAGTIGQAVSQIYLRDGGRIKNDTQNLSKLFTKTFRFAITLGSLVAFAIFILGEPIFEFTFGQEKWWLAITLVRWLSLYVGMHFVLSVLAPCSILLDRNWFAWGANVLQHVSFLGGLFAAIWLDFEFFGTIVLAHYASFFAMLFIVLKYQNWNKC